MISSLLEDASDGGDLGSPKKDVSGASSAKWSDAAFLREVFSLLPPETRKSVMLEEVQIRLFFHMPHWVYLSSSTCSQANASLSRGEPLRHARLTLLAASQAHFPELAHELGPQLLAR